MGLFSGLFKRKPPAWSGFSDRAVFDRFIDRAGAALASAGHPQERFRLESGEAVFAVPAGDAHARIHDLAHACAQLPEDQWEPPLQTFARTKGDPLGDQRPPAPPKAPKVERLKFDRGLVRSQIFSAEYIGVVAADAILKRPLFDGLFEVVMLAIPGGEVTLGRGEARQSGLSDDELFALGRVQSAAATQTTVTPLVSEGRPIEVAVSNDFYLAAQALEVFERLEAPDGVVACFVSWHHVCTAVLAPGEKPEAALAALKSFVAVLEPKISVTASEALFSRIGYFKKGEGWTAVA
ncbi:MAG: hypothetical protein QM723_36440 [Myxococcaceae bacterium]